MLFDYYILDIGCREPRRPPYYSKTFFLTIKEALVENLDVFIMTVKDWYKRLLKEITHNPDTSLIQSRTEYLFPFIDHSNSTACIRNKELNS